MTGYTATVNGVCTDKFDATGQTGQDPPTICGTNTGYHMYVEFGATSSDTIEVKTTYGAAGSKQWNILARQIACTDKWKAPTDCVQYFTGVSGTVQSYNFGNQILQSQNYHNCIRQEKGYCRIKWQESSSTTPDPFQMDTATAGSPTAAGGVTGDPAIAHLCVLAQVTIPDGSPNGVTPLDSTIPTVASLSSMAYQSEWCGSNLGYTNLAVSTSVTSARQPFNLGVWTAASALAPGGTGFNLDFTQLPC